MAIIGKVQSICRYPVKSMRGQELDEAFLGFAGLYGDRIFAFTNSAGRKSFPYFTAREQPEMLQYHPRFRSTEKAAHPPNLTEAEKLGPGVTPLYSRPQDMMVDVQTPSGEIFPIDDPQLTRMLTHGLPDAYALTLVQSDRSMTDCRPISIFSVQTVQQLSSELGTALDPLRFRANLYLDLPSAGGYGEQALVGRSIRIGSKAVVHILERDPRCKMITLNPDTGESDPTILRQVAQAHDSTAGVYGAVLVEGTLRKGDPVALLD